MTELSIRPEEIRDALQKYVDDYKPSAAAKEEVGTVATAGDGIARVSGLPSAMANELGLRNVAFEVDDLHAAVDWLAADGYGLVGGIGEYEHSWRMAYVRGPEGIIVSLAERIG